MNPAQPRRRRRWTRRRWLGVTTTVVVIAVAGLGVGLTAAGAGASAGCLTHRAVASSPRPSRAQQEKVLDAAYAQMLHGPLCLGSPGSRDVVDYGIGKLWREGIDGAGTTIALAEGWDDRSINRQVDHFDRLGSLPNPQIATIYPSGDHKLPARCPVNLGASESCSSSSHELELDVLAAHLVAPYAKILIVVTPGDSEVREDPVNEGGPEMMQGVEAISRDHLATSSRSATGPAKASTRTVATR